MNAEIRKFHDFLQKYRSYQSMIEVGSVAAGDPWIEGRSDRDILLIFDDAVPYEAMRKYLVESKFGDEFLFTPLSTSEFIGPMNHSHDFSHRFRSTCHFGENLVDKVVLPNEDVTQKIYENGLARVRDRLLARMLNASFWSENRTRGVFWKSFKHAFMHLAIREYATTGAYPRTRAELAKGVDSLEEACNVLHGINTQPRENILCVAERLVDYLTITISQ